MTAFRAIQKSVQSMFHGQMRELLTVLAILMFSGLGVGFATFVLCTAISTAMQMVL